MYLTNLIADLIGGIGAGIISDRYNHVIVFSLLWTAINVISLFSFERKQFAKFAKDVRIQEIKLKIISHWNARVVWLLFRIFQSFIVSLLVGFIVLSAKNLIIIRSDRFKGDCINYRDKQTFNKPISIVWTAKFDGCLRSCWGAAFTRDPSDPKYPRFSGYVPENGNSIAEEFRRGGQTLRIYGKWIDVSDSYGSVFHNSCVPTVSIDKIEIVK